MEIGAYICIIVVIIIALLFIWAIWGEVPWKTVGKICLTLLIIGIAIAIIVGIISSK
jgi:hypothetical protein